MYIQENVNVNLSIPSILQANDMPDWGRVALSIISDANKELDAYAEMHPNMSIDTLRELDSIRSQLVIMSNQVATGTITVDQFRAEIEQFNQRVGKLPD